MQKDTLIIMTGGTIDAEAYPDPKHPPHNATMLTNSLIPGTLAEMGFDKRCDYLPWKAKDSKNFTTGEMRDLAKIIRTAQHRNIIITHGTDAMPEHSRKIATLLQKPEPDLRNDAGAGRFIRGEGVVHDKTVVFTGAMMPLANGPMSDAYQNLAYIFKHMDDWQPGVRVVMHGASFEPFGLTKDFDSYTFKGRTIPETNQGLQR